MPRPKFFEIIFTASYKKQLT